MKRILAALLLTMVLWLGSATVGSHAVPCHQKPFGKAVQFLSLAGWWRWQAHALDVDGAEGKGIDDQLWVDRAEADYMVEAECR